MRKSILFITLSFAFLNLISAQEWNTDFLKAKETAVAKNKPIVLVFQGSDWCAPCIKLSENILKTDYFISYSKENFVLLKADFTRSKKNKISKEQMEANAQMFEKYNQSGTFPLVVVLDNKGNVLGKTGYKNISPKEYLKELNSFIN